VLYWHFVVMPKYTIGVHGLSSWGLAWEVDMEHGDGHVFFGL